MFWNAVYMIDENKEIGQIKPNPDGQTLQSHADTPEKNPNLWGDK